MNIEQLFNKVSESEELSNQLKELLEDEDKEKLAAWVKEQGCDASLGEIKDYLIERTEELKESGELTPEQLDMAAGGSALFMEITIGIGLFVVGAGAGAGIVAGVKAIFSSC